MAGAVSIASADGQAGENQTALPRHSIGGRIVSSEKLDER